MWRYLWILVILPVGMPARVVRTFRSVGSVRGMKVTVRAIRLPSGPIGTEQYDLPTIISKGVMRRTCYATTVSFNHHTVS